MGISCCRRAGIASAFVSAAAAALWFAACAGPTSQLTRDADRPSALFGRHCAACHGTEGNADSALALFLRPKPRSFALGSFNIVSTSNGVPTDDDLVRALERGLPGSTMPSFAWLPEEDLRALAQHVRKLAIDGAVAAQGASARSAGRSFDSKRARTVAEHQFQAAFEVQVPDPMPATADVLARGGELFVERCAACHGRDGKGFGEEPSWSQRSEFAWARDLTAGILKGGATHRDLYWRIACGMPAVGMPPARLNEADTGAVVAYVQTLLPPHAADHLVQRRAQLTVERTATALPTSADDPRWHPTPVVVAPLQWHQRAVHRVEVAMLHDGKDLAMLLRWPDDSRNDQPTGIFPDAVAVQLADDVDPPAIAMGTSSQPVHIWHWRAFQPRDLAGDLDALMPRPDGARADVPLQPRPPALDALADAAVNAHGRGAGSMRPFRDAAAELHVQPRWENGTWTLLLRRPLAGKTHEDLDLVPGRRLHLACAVWNGAANDSGVRKAVSVWHRLDVAP